MLKIKSAEIVNQENNVEEDGANDVLYMLAECMCSNASVFLESTDGELSLLWTLKGASIKHDEKKGLLFLDTGCRRITFCIELKPDLGPGWYASLPADTWENGYLTIDGKKLLKIYF